jgi:hypothetical protein
MRSHANGWASLPYSVLKDESSYCIELAHKLKDLALPQNLWVKRDKNWGFPPQTPRILEA